MAKGAPMQNEASGYAFISRKLMSKSSTLLVIIPLVIYCLSRIVMSIFTLIAQGNILDAILTLLGSLMVACGLVYAYIGCKLDDNIYAVPLYGYYIACGGFALCAVNSIIHMVTDGEILGISEYGLEFMFMLVCAVFFFQFAMSESEKKLTSKLGTIAGIIALVLLIVSFIRYISCIGTFSNLFRETFLWEALATEYAGLEYELEWLLIGTPATSIHVKGVFFMRVIERALFLLITFSAMLFFLRSTKFIENVEQKIQFARDAGGAEEFFELYGARSYAKQRSGGVRESRRNASSAQEEERYDDYQQDETSYEIDYSPDYDIPRSTTEPDEYGYYYDENGVPYYYDERTGEYYYVEDAYDYPASGGYAPPADSWDAAGAEYDEDSLDY